MSADWLASPRVQWLAVGWESALAFWLFSNWRANLVRWVTVATFGVFAAVSLHEAVAGKRTCCCFGMVQATPWVVFGLDIAIAARLYLVRGITVQYPLNVRFQRTMAITVTALSIISGVTAAAWHNGARPGLQIHNWPESPLVVQPGSRTEWAFKIHNPSDEPVQIGRIATSCECFRLETQGNRLAPQSGVTAKAIFDLTTRPEQGDDLWLIASAFVIDRPTLLFRCERTVHIR